MKLNTIRIPCTNLKESEVFYTEHLGLLKLFGSEVESFIGYKLDNVQVIIEPEEKGEFESGRYLGFSIEVDNLNQFYACLNKIGVKFTGAPEEQLWGGLMTHIIDPSNNTFSIVQVESVA